MKTLGSIFLCVLFCTVVSAQPTTLVEWNFSTSADVRQWSHVSHITSLPGKGGVIEGRILNWDPFLRSPQFEIPASPYQRIEIRIKTDCGGQGDLFWTNTTESDYGGFSPGKQTPFEVHGDDQWHEYHVYPFWHKEGKIVLLRVDFPRPVEADYGRKKFAIDFVRVVDLGTPKVFAESPEWDFTQGMHDWHVTGDHRLYAMEDGVSLASGEDHRASMLSGPLRCSAQDSFWLNVQMRVDRGTAAHVRWVSSKHTGFQTAKFPIKADGRFHNYNVDLSSHKTWAGNALLLGLQPTNVTGARAVVRKIALGIDPMGEAEVECTYLGLADAVNRAGRPATLLLNLVNRGGTATVAGELRVSQLELPEGISVIDDGPWRDLPSLEPLEPISHRIPVLATAPIEGPVAVQLIGPAAPLDPLLGTVRISQALDLPPVDYVPEPQVVESNYEIGAFYFPGWASMAKWQPVRSLAPQRKPVLGWYDESNPECVDWQIKWAVEHGIKFFLVDWYWTAGNRHLEHWLEAYKQAKYRSCLQWAMMWANHNPPGSHSDSDMREVAQFWVDNYFGMPEYMRIDDRPVVMIWSPANIRRDLGGEDGGRRGLEIARQVARDAGYQGIYFVAMKWPEASTDSDVIRPLADDGYDMTSIYHYMHHGDRAEDAKHFPFELVARSSDAFWRSRHAADVLPFLPNLSTGWDSRPWHGDSATVIHDRSVPQFRKICEDAKQFADETGVKRLVLAPLNEWGEGSYAEPNKEFGFGMYDAVRDVFCERPATGWPANVTPRDVGLGPYDFAEANTTQSVVAWTFASGTEAWTPLMGVTEILHKDGAIHFQTTSDDPAIATVLHKADASAYRFVRIRMQINATPTDEKAQLFWSTTTSPISEANSVRFELIGDGQFHDYVVPLHENRRWRGRINSFRFDPCGHRGADISVAEVRLTREGG